MNKEGERNILYFSNITPRSRCHVQLVNSSPSCDVRQRRSCILLMRRFRVNGQRLFATAISLIFILAVFTDNAHAQVKEKFECLPNGCCDQHEWCAFWASIGECENNRVWMHINCQLACKSCPADGAKAQTKAHNSTRHPKTILLTRVTKTIPPTTADTSTTIGKPTATPTTPVQKVEIETAIIPKTTADILINNITTPPSRINIGNAKQEAPTKKVDEVRVPTVPVPTPPAKTDPPTSTVLPEETAEDDAQSGNSTNELVVGPKLVSISTDPIPTTVQPEITVPPRHLNDTDVPKPQHIVPPMGPKMLLGNNAGRCEEHRRSGVSNVIQWIDHEGLIAEKEDISFRRTFSTQDIFTSNNQFGCSPRQDFTDCSKNICYNLRFRTMDGSCNNFQNPLFGSAAIPFIRLKPPLYDDGIQAPTATVQNSRPSSRDVSRFLLSSPQLVINDKLNTLVMQYGQFIVHDITKTSLLPTDKCIGCTEIQGRCSPIKANQFDTRFGCSTPPCCLSFTRAASVCGTGTNSPRAQLNENTAFVDGSMIYGSSVADNNRLRDGALMRSTPFKGHSFLPFNQQQCFDVANCNANFDAGDNRITIFVGLAAFHTLFVREHNRIAPILQQVNPRWTVDRVFHETRKIVGAELQAVTYKEWLPKILGSSFETIIGPYKGYIETLDASISSEFSHAAMRFGHGMIQESFNRTEVNGLPIPAGSMRFEDGVLKPQRLLFEGGVDPLLRGMMTMPLKRPQRVTVAVTEKLFGSTDLVAINLQRGRDVGLPGYNDWREFCGLKRAESFDDLRTEILDKNVRTNLQQGYKTPDAMDLYAATLLEDPVLDGLVGPTPACLIGDQFRRIRDGDRFWYQSPAAFTPEQLAELEKVTFARILCDTGDDFQSVPPNAFEMPTGSNKFVLCNAIPFMDLSKWRE